MRMMIDPLPVKEFVRVREIFTASGKQWELALDNLRIGLYASRDEAEELLAQVRLVIGSRLDQEVQQCRELVCAWCYQGKPTVTGRWAPDAVDHIITRRPVLHHEVCLAHKLRDRRHT